MARACPGKGGGQQMLMPRNQCSSQSRWAAIITGNVCISYWPTLLYAGIIAHDGRNIPFVELAKQVQVTYNMAPTFCIFLSKYMATFMKKDYGKDAFDLKELDEHNKIEHDGSLIRTLAYNDCLPYHFIPLIRRRYLFRARLGKNCSSPHRKTTR